MGLDLILTVSLPLYVWALQFGIMFLAVKCGQETGKAYARGENWYAHAIISLALQLSVVAVIAAGAVKVAPA